MPWPDTLAPVRMQRVAVAAPAARRAEVFAQVADAGCIEVDDGDGRAPAAALAPDETDVAARSAAAFVQHRVAAIVGWMPAEDVPSLAARIAGIGGAVVPLARPRGVEPPTLLPPTGRTRDFAPLVQTYGTVRYADVNPTVLAGIAYVVMFGMMFADFGHGALLVVGALLVRAGWPPWLRRLRPVWWFLMGAGLASMLFGALYGEFFGPTGALPVLWLAPLDHPVPLLLAAAAFGAFLLAGAYAIGSVNRVREGGWRLAMYSPSGMAGAMTFVGFAAAAGGLYLHAAVLGWFGVALAVIGLALCYAGLYVTAGGGAAAAGEAGVEIYDQVVRLGSNVISFTRLAAFGLTHAALCLIVWQGATALWHRGPIGAAAAALVFVIGNAVAFGLEGFIAAVQALRLEYYELFSRIFDGEGRPFRPWHVPLTRTEVRCPG